MPITHTPAAFGFNGHDRRRLAKALKRTEKASVYRRLQAVLLVASGYAVNQVAQITGALRRAVYQWVNRYLATQRVDSLADRPRSGRPSTATRITDTRILREWRRDPLRLGYNTTVQTVVLLARHLSTRYDCAITPRTLRRRMKRLCLRWKRPRYVYTLKDPHRAQKKGGLSAA